MARHYKRKTQRQSWNEDNMKKALEAVSVGMGKKTAARQFGIPVMTLKRRAFVKTTDENSENGDPDDPTRMEILTHTPQPESHKLPPSSTVACPLDKNHRAHTKTSGPQPEMSMSPVKLGLPATLTCTSTAPTTYTFNSPRLDLQPETASIGLAV
ncbi:hypothetical protein PR048_003680 [Dryococelus australis]|uniref:HTH psq-type domain-containing protein n=1 Tax=Dryococelus australis TaxID=614101 RepID=A0ABQ9INU7_9NEOP|nr:hypothetical protein PR048_003680 [Dryococelus australis]